MIEIYLLDWLSLMIKFLHVIVGIAWIGASFYFNWLENKLNRHAGQKTDIAGHLWAVHGGGFYYLEKYKKYPDNLPEPLHWFKWEAYVTWLSGVALLGVIYYFNASSYLLAPQSTLTPMFGILLSVVGLIVFWLFYHYLCSLLSERPRLLIGLLVLFVVVASYFYFQVFNPRAAYMQIGAMLGTIMVANVFFVIIPVQKLLVQACADKTPISAEPGLRGYTRSRHNNYLTLPVLFVMISGHYPMVYNTTYGWLALIVAFVISIAIRHYFNLKGVNKAGVGWVIFAALTLLLLIVALAPSSVNISAQKEKVSFVQVQAIIDKHCVVCHSATPNDDIFRVAPSGFVLDTKAQILAAKDLIYSRSVATHSMPFNNKTNMSDDERQMLGAWIITQKGR